MSSPLQTISIERSDTTYNGLIELLQSHKTQLRTLKLRQIRVIMLASSRSFALLFLRFSRDDLNLTYLEIDDFFEAERWPSDLTTSLPALKDLVCEGRQEVIEGLESLIEEVNGEYQDELPESSSEESSGEYEDDWAGSEL
jgi:hypothetical protein